MYLYSAQHAWGTLLQGETLHITLFLSQVSCKNQEKFQLHLQVVSITLASLQENIFALNTPYSYLWD